MSALDKKGYPIFIDTVIEAVLVDAPPSSEAEVLDAVLVSTPLYSGQTGPFTTGNTNHLSGFNINLVVSLRNGPGENGHDSCSKATSATHSGLPNESA